MTNRTFSIATVALVIIVCGVFLRFYRFQSVFTEYDDIGVVSVHRAQLVEDTVSQRIENPFLSAEIILKSPAIREHFLSSPLFPFAIAKLWTYPPGPYLTYPLFMRDDRSYEFSLSVGRITSALFSVAALLFTAYLLFVYDGKGGSPEKICALCLAAFSYNSVIYAHHMGPYAAGQLTSAVALLLAHFFLHGRLSAVSAGILLGITTWFSYSVLLFVLPLALTILVYRFERVNRSAFVGAALYLVIVLPLLVLFLKPEQAMRGIEPPAINDSVVNFVRYGVSQTVRATSSVLASFSVETIVNLFVSCCFLVALPLVLVRSHFSSMRAPPLVFLSAIFVCEWIGLHMLRRIVLDETRHMIVWLPSITLLVGFLLSKVLLPRFCWVVIGSAWCVAGLVSGVNLLDTKRTNLDLEYLAALKPRTVLVFGGTMSPFAFFKSPVEVLHGDFSSFWRVLNSRELDPPIYAVSQNGSFERWKSSLSLDRQILLQGYDVDPVVELSSNTYYTYNDVPRGSNPNGFFLYRLEPKTLRLPPLG